MTAPVDDRAPVPLPVNLMTLTPEKPQTFCRLLPAIILALASGAARSPASIAGESPLGFNRDIRPILSDKCFACHGFDAKQRKAGLRLDTAEGALGATESGAVAIKPGDLDGSELWRRINSDDAGERMPPSKSHKTLTTQQKATIRQWIEQGAHYQKHWAFEPPVRRRRRRWLWRKPTRSMRFIGDRLHREGLTPSPEADRETLLRRVSFDLTGLPPSLEEIDGFLG